MAFRAQGLRIGIRANTPELLDRVRALLPPGWKPAANSDVDQLYSLVVGGAARGIRRLNLVYSGATRVARTADLEEALRLLEIDLHLYVAERARRRTFVHAGVVGWAGRAVLIPGRSFSGKSTLVAALVRAGASYFSDEFALLDSRGRVHPYPIPLALREQGGGRPPKKLTVEALAGTTGAAPLPVGLIVFTRYEAGARWRPRPLSEGRALLEMLDHTLPARRSPRRVMDVLARVVCEAQILKGPRGEAPEVAGLLLRLCAEGAVPRGAKPGLADSKPALIPAGGGG